MLGLHPTSVEYYPLTRRQPGAQGVRAVVLRHRHRRAADRACSRTSEPVDLLRRLGYAGEEMPDLLTKIYRGRQKPLDGPVVDDVPLSETAPIRAYAGGRNYIEWLADAAAQDSIAAVQAEQGFDGRQATDRAAVPAAAARRAARASTRRRSSCCSRPARRATSRPCCAASRRSCTSPTMPPRTQREPVRRAVPGRPARDQRRRPAHRRLHRAQRARCSSRACCPSTSTALDRLATLPTARLERLFAEHIDTASYRLDAWKTGLIDLGLQRPARAAAPSRRTSTAVAAGGDGADGPAGSTSAPTAGSSTCVRRARPPPRSTLPPTSPTSSTHTTRRR